MCLGLAPPTRKPPPNTGRLRGSLSQPSAPKRTLDQSDGGSSATTTEKKSRAVAASSERAPAPTPAQPQAQAARSVKGNAEGSAADQLAHITHLSGSTLVRFFPLGRAVAPTTAPAAKRQRRLCRHGPIARPANCLPNARICGSADRGWPVIMQHRAHRNLGVQRRVCSARRPLPLPRLHRTLGRRRQRARSSRRPAGSLCRRPKHRRRRRPQRRLRPPIRMDRPRSSWPRTRAAAPTSSAACS